VLAHAGARLRLNGPSLEIVERCDGSTPSANHLDLQKIYSKAEPQKG